MKRTVTSLMVVFALAGAVQQASAATAWITATVSSLLVTEESAFGACLIRPGGADLSSLDCPTQWVTVDCAGTLGGSKGEAARKWDALNLAAVMKVKARMRVDDSQKINGWCFVDRVQIQPR